jgi:NAD(P)H-dependent flavin oxidoreductase YrpB (nitropropane dioxygenase family)
MLLMVSSAMRSSLSSASFADKLGTVMISGKEVFPIIEGGKGVGVSNGVSAGAFAAAGAVGTFSGVNPERRDANGDIIPYVYHATTRRERHEELVAMSIEGAVQQATHAYELSGGNGRIHMNVLWEMGGAERVLVGTLERAGQYIHGITCGAGMPYKLGELAAHYHVYYHPIVSSMRAFRALWKRSYSRTKDWLGSVVYEDPWLAGGHNGLTNGEDPNIPKDPYPRVAELRRFMNEEGLQHVPIVMAGGAWYLQDWEHWLDNPEIGAIAFQFGTRPLLTKESPIPNVWKKRLLTLKKGDVFLNRFSPTGFYSSAVNNQFIQELREREERQIPYRAQPDAEYAASLPFGPRKRPIYVRADDAARAEAYIAAGYSELMKTPDDTIIFVRQDTSIQIHEDQVNCMGCLSHCRFSNWKDHDDYTTGKKADPRSFCIQKTLQNIVYGASVEHNLMFSGHNAYKFGEDPFYHEGHIPTVAQLVERIRTGL